MIHTSLSPNAERDDVLLAFRLLGALWVPGFSYQTAVKDLEKNMAEKLSATHVRAVATGRTALYCALRALSIGAGDEVIIQSFTCVAVPGPILWVGATPVYADVTDAYVIDQASVASLITTKTKAVIVQHTFGKSGLDESLFALAKEHNLFIIEDCAHAFGAQWQGSSVGVRGDIAIWSFGRDKALSSVFGGLISTKHDHLRESIDREVACLVTPPRWWVAQQLMHPLVLALAKMTYEWLSFGKIILEISKRAHLTSKAVERSEYDGGKPRFWNYAMSGFLAKLALQQSNKLERFREHRHTIAKIYNDQLKGIEGITYSPYDAEHGYLRFALHCDNKEMRGRILRAMRNNGIYLGDWYDTPIAPRGVNLSTIKYDDRVHARRLSDGIINLPTHIGITVSDAMLICSIIKKSCEH